MVVVLVLAAVVFMFAKAPACAVASAAGDFARRRNLWIGITLIIFLAHNFWIYIVFAGALLLFLQRREPNKIAMYFFLLLAVPAIPDDVPALGIVNFLFAIDYVRLLALTVLLPAYLSLRTQPGIERFGRSIPDKLIAGYLILIPLLMLENAPFTSTLRQGVFYPFVDIFLPYYVVSRGLKSVQSFRDALMAFLVAALVLSATLAFEFALRWLLYGALERALGAHWGFGQFLLRGENLRALGTVGHPIIAGYIVAVAMGFFLYLRKLVPSPKARGLAWLLLAVGLIAPVSRGPWVGAAAMLMVFIATGPAPVRGLAKLGLFGVVALPLLLTTTMGGKIIDHLPWVGTVEEANVIGRAHLAEVAMQVILENPFFGRFDVLHHPALEALRGIDGIIDLVNTYVIVGLGRGLVGLSLFVGFFLAVVFSIYRSMWNLADRNDERYVLGQVLIATLLGTMVVIGTVSPVAASQATYWSLAGLGVAYARMLATGRASEAAEASKSRLATAKVAT